MKQREGLFVISLDFELLYGMNQPKDTKRWMHNAKGAREAIPAILQLFEQYEIRATWAIVGMLFAADKADLKNSFPVLLPQYEQKRFSNYELLETIGEDEKSDALHYAGDLIRQITDSGTQEIATHTFSHYYCMEKGQTAGHFRADILAAKAIAEQRGITLQSLVFPKNQYQEGYLDHIQDMGLTAFRGNEEGLLYRPSASGESRMKRALRLLDSYVNLTGYHCYSLENLPAKGVLCNIPASRFLRPYMGRLARLEGLKIARIKGQMRHAAKRGLLFHLWWHPHNFGSHREENLNNLRSILAYYKKLQEQYGFTSVSMAEAAEKKRKTSL